MLLQHYRSIYKNAYLKGALAAAAAAVVSTAAQVAMPDQIAVAETWGTAASASPISTAYGSVSAISAGGSVVVAAAGSLTTTGVITADAGTPANLTNAGTVTFGKVGNTLTDVVNTGTIKVAASAADTFTLLGTLDNNGTVEGKGEKNINIKTKGISGAEGIITSKSA
ncbi:MAG: hypothetical protein IJ228_04660, partial [Succinivibrio sp.]|nr:hypothetical protein [Succinivibrio sp.]